MQIEITKTYMGKNGSMKAVRPLPGFTMSGAQWLTVLMAVNGWTAAQIAEKIGVSRHSIDSYRCGRTAPSAETAKKMEIHLGMPTSVRWR